MKEGEGEEGECEADRALGLLLCHSPQAPTLRLSRHGNAAALAAASPTLLFKDSDSDGVCVRVYYCRTYYKAACGFFSICPAVKNTLYIIIGTAVINTHSPIRGLWTLESWISRLRGHPEGPEALSARCSTWLVFF